MKYKIREVTYGDEVVEYAPMLHKGFWSGWSYMYSEARLPKWFKTYHEAIEHINYHKKEKIGSKITKTKDILID